MLHSLVKNAQNARKLCTAAPFYFSSLQYDLVVIGGGPGGTLYLFSLPFPSSLPDIIIIINNNLSFLILNKQQATWQPSRPASSA